MRLPAQMTSTIGRSEEIGELVALLRRRDTRLVTLTGPGGVGKTRLALEVARALKHEFSDGVYFVSLAPLRDPAQVVQAVALALSVEETREISLERRLCEYLSNKHVLLLLDNFEHLLSAATMVSNLLAAAPCLTVLTTSREMLRLYGEQERVVLPLKLPQLAEEAAPIVSAAMALFVERAQAVQPTFTLQAHNWQAVAAICIQLDGLPLAIELAAARCKLLAPQAILARLGSRLTLLVGGARDLPRRQQTLRNTLNWSYDLLDQEEQRFFRRLGVFVGSWTFEAAEALTREGLPDPLYLLTSLVDKSLVSLSEQMPGGTRFFLLETIREYALECLVAEGEYESAHFMHTHFYITLAEEIAGRLHSLDQQVALQQLDRESANLWEALRWSIQRNEAKLALRLADALSEYLPLRHSLHEEHQWLEEVLGLEGGRDAYATRGRVLYGAGLLARMRGDSALARAHLEESRAMALQSGDLHISALALGALAQLELFVGNYPAARALVEDGLQTLDEKTENRWCRGILHRIAGNLASKQGDFATAQTRYSLSLMLLRDAGDLRNQAETLVNLGSLARQRGKLRTAHYLYERSLQLFRELGDRWGQLACLNCMGEALRVQADYARASQCFAESLSLVALLGDRAEQVVTLTGLGQLALCLDQPAQAARRFKEALHLARAIDSPPGLIQVLCGLGDLERAQGNWASSVLYYIQGLELVKLTNDKLMRMYLLSGLGDAAREQGKLALACSQLKQSLFLAWEIGNISALPAGMEALAWLCVQADQPEHGALLLGAAFDLRESLQMPLAPVYQTTHSARLEALKAAIGQNAFQECWAQGRSLLLKQILHLSIAQVHISENAAQPGPDFPASPYHLTRRERDVLRLLAQGYADARIASMLVISPRTVNTHLRSIYAKLGVSSRSAATRLAIEQHLI